jgi:hypothetical protein
MEHKRFATIFVKSRSLVPIQSEVNPDGNIVMDLINALPDNSSINMFQRATMVAVSQWRML